MVLTLSMASFSNVVLNFTFSFILSSILGDFAALIHLLRCYSCKFILQIQFVSLIGAIFKVILLNKHRRHWSNLLNLEYYTRYFAVTSYHFCIKIDTVSNRMLILSTWKLIPLGCFCLCPFCHDCLLGKGSREKIFSYDQWLTASQKSVEQQDISADDQLLTSL